MTDLDILKALVPVVLSSSGAAWLGVRIALNGTRKAIADGRREAREGFDKVHADMKRIEGSVGDARERIARLEGRLT